MTDQPMNTSGLRGAVDLSGLQGGASTSAGQGAGPTAGAGRPGAGAGGPGGAGGAGGSGVPGRSGILVEGGDANFTEVVNGSVSVPAVVVLWSSGLPESRTFLDTVVAVARTYDGKFQVVSINVDENPGLLRAFQVQSVPMTMGLVQGQPVPLFAGVQTEENLR